MVGNEVVKNFKKGVKIVFEIFLLGNDYNIFVFIGIGGWVNVFWIVVYDKEISISV